MPQILPFINDDRFDLRRDKNWKSEILSFLENEGEYTKNVLEYEKVVEVLNKTADMLIQEINQ
jgi:hypothetical protein